MITKHQKKAFKTQVEMYGFVSAFRASLCWVLKKFNVWFEKLVLPKRPDFDKQYGTVTNELVKVEDGHIPAAFAEDAVQYVATNVVVIRHICKKLPIDHSDFTFVDMGCGRGRAVLLASEFPYKKIVGVELSPTHHEIAVNNLSVYPSDAQRCTDIDIIHANVLEYSIPDGNLVFYLYQPFGGEVLRKVIENIAEAGGQESEIYLCFSCPGDYQDTILENGYFQELDNFPVYEWNDCWILYGNEKAVATYKQRPDG